MNSKGVFIIGVIRLEKAYSKAKDIAIYYLGYRARSEKEVVDKLSSKGYDKSIIDKVIDFLKEYDYVNDKKFADSYVRDKNRFKPVGRKKLAYELKQKGISNEIIDHVLDNTDLNELDSALRLIRKKAPNSTLDIKEKQKIYQFLSRRGFDYYIIKQALEKFYAEDMIE